MREFAKDDTPKGGWEHRDFVVLCLEFCGRPRHSDASS